MSENVLFFKITLSLIVILDKTLISFLFLKIKDIIDLSKKYLSVISLKSYSLSFHNFF